MICSALIAVVLMAPGDRPAAGASAGLVRTVSSGGAFVMERVLAPEMPTIFAFYQETSAADKGVVARLEDRVKRSGKVGLRLIRLRNLDGPAAQAYDIRQTPTLMVLDRFGRMMVRTHDPDE